MYSCQTISKTPDSFVNCTCGKLSQTFSSATFNSETVETVLGFRWRFQNSFVCHSPDTISLTWPSFLFNHLRTVLMEHCWETRAMRAEPHASCWICCSVWQQSVAFFNEIQKQKLLHSFNYCLQKITTKIASQCCHCCVKVLLIFVEINEN